MTLQVWCFVQTVQEQIEQSKAEESTQSVVPGTVRAAAEQAENFLNGTKLPQGAERLEC